MASPAVRTVIVIVPYGFRANGQYVIARGLGVEPGVLDIADDADDLVLEVVPGDADALADRILVRASASAPSSR